MPEIRDFSPKIFCEQLSLTAASNTAVKYRRVAEHFIEALPELAIDSIFALPADTLIRYRDLVIQKHQFGPSTVHVYIAGIRKYIRWLQTKGVPCPVMHDLELPRVKYKVKETIPAHLMQKYIDLAQEVHEPFRTAVQLGPFVGLRGSEYVSLTLENLNIKKIKTASGEIKTTFMFKLTGKGGDEKLVPVLDEGVPILNRYLTGWRAKRSSKWLFPVDAKGRKHIADRTFRDKVQKICFPLGVHVSPHTLRRTYGRLLYKKGVDPATIAKIFGHKRVDTLMQHYLAVDGDDIMRQIYGDK